MSNTTNLSAIDSTAAVSGAITTALWLEQLGLDRALTKRPALAGDCSADVVIVGGGFSGLWTAYYLNKLDPSLSIHIVEREFCGFGASGRNGGWAVGDLAGSFDTYAKMSSAAESLRLTRAMFDSVHEIGRVAAVENISCGYAKGGNIRLARNTPQRTRQIEEVAHARNIGLTEDEIRLLGPDEARSYLDATRVSGGIFFAPCASLNPAELARGLALTVEASGVKISEGTAVSKIEGRRVITEHGVISANVVVRATEAYTRDLEGQRRTLLPIYSLMIATEPLPESIFEEIGLADRPTFSDDRFMVIYGQRTADNRIAFGGRGVPYLFGSRIDEKTARQSVSHALIHKTLVDLLPVLRDVQITHRWGGVLGVPRDWVPGLRFDPVEGQGVLGGYVGEGVAAANLAGQTMAELITGHPTERTTLPWVGHESRTWEPEPFRWLGVRGSRRILVSADKREDETDKEAKLAYRISRLLKGA